MEKKAVIKKIHIGDILVAKSLITDKQLNTALSELDDIGINDAIKHSFRHIIRQPYGLVLVTALQVVVKQRPCMLPCLN